MANTTREAAAAASSSAQATLEAMGYAAGDVKRALNRCAGDVDRAADLLVSNSGVILPSLPGDEDEVLAASSTRFSSSPHDVLVETADPYRRDSKKRPDPVPNDPDKGNFREGLGSEADPGEILDSRLSTLRAMGFSVVDAEAALEAAHNDVNRAISLLLNLNAGSTYFHESPHDVLAEAADPYRREDKKRPPPSDKATDATKGHWRDDLRPDAGPAEVVDSRIATLAAMGFDAQAAEAALRDADNDVNKALSNLLEKKSNKPLLDSS